MYINEHVTILVFIDFIFQKCLPYILNAMNVFVFIESNNPHKRRI